MSRTLIRFGLAAFLVLGGLAAETALAGEIVFTRDDTGDDAYSAGAGGEYKVTKFTGQVLPPMGPGVALTGGVFQTFCIERNEFVTMGKTYEWEMSDAAVNGGVGGGNPDPLGAEAAYLYHEFWYGRLDGYVYDTLGVDERAESADQLQHALWYLENELASLDTTTHSQAWQWVQDAQTAVANGDWTGIGNVRVLNLYTTDSSGVRTNHQDVLTVVPLPPAALMGLMLLTGIGLHQRRRRRMG
jgi:hypothetical protein